MGAALVLCQAAPPRLPWSLPQSIEWQFPTNASGGARSTLDVKTFGARGDGVTNDSAAIAAAIAAARDGDDIFFPSGIYICNDVDITGKNNITLRGRGESSIVRNGLAGSSSPLMTFTNVARLTIQDLAFDNRSIGSFGGVRFYNSETVVINRTHFFDSSPLPLGSADRYSFVFGNGTQPHKDIRITNNLIEDLQLEVDFGQGVTISRNTVNRGVRTGAIGLFTIDHGVTFQDYSIDSNTIIDPVGAAIAINVDPPDNNNVTFRNIAVTNNKIIFNHTPTGAIHVGPANNSTSASGNIYDGVTVRNNVIQIASGAGAQPEDSALIKFNAGPNSALNFKNTLVDQNQIQGGGNTNLIIVGMDLRYLENSTVTDNTAYDTFTTFAFNRLLNTRIEQNGVAQINDYPPYVIDNSRGGNLFRNNFFSGPVTTPLIYLNGNATDVISTPIFKKKP
jgi:hypothetical protein